ncbi:hypothetical protein [Cumulibacter manganitolerans]|uniref:hypothetical protein n=1 Tax=Cumulibacter manganitolerans TaxID=1884992 RepID=UPI001E30D65F|nr:hypothetical protein [Cumulibacter manganitolerans]
MSSAARTSKALLAGLGLVLASGCARADTDLERTAATFSESAANDPVSACALLAPKTRQELESERNEPCDSAIAGVALPRGGAVVRSEVAGHSGQVVLRGDTVFLSLFDDGWKVTAAGCRPQDASHDLPYDCSVKGG